MFMIVVCCVKFKINSLVCTLFTIHQGDYSYVVMDGFLNSPPKPLRTVSLSGTKAVVTPLSRRHVSSPFPHLSYTCESQFPQGPSRIHAHYSESDGPPETVEPVTGVSSLAYEGAMVDQCIQNVLSLPEEVGEVALKHKCLTAEINRQQSLLNKAKEVLKTRKVQKECLLEEVGKVNRKVCLTQENAALKSKLCIQLENDIYILVSENLAVNQKLEAVQEEWIKKLKIYAECREKMGKHMHSVADVEATHPINIAVAEQQQKVELLRKQLQELKCNTKRTDAILTGECERMVQSEINVLKAKEIKVNKEIMQKQEKLKATQDREAKIKQDIDILQKRNHAQLTRLKRQVKEAQVRNRQWNEEACELEKNIAELRLYTKE